MGLPMSDIHNPTVGSSSSPPPTSTAETEDVRALIKQKENVEAELSALGSVLDSHGVNMETPLLTRDGFPRADIDVAQIRMTRSRIVRLRNDHKALMKRIDAGLEAYFAAGNMANLAVRPASGGASTTASASGSRAAAPDPPFARVNSVATGSPAHSAGLVTGDLVVKFGDAHWLNHDKLSRLAGIVAQSEGVSIAITVERDGQEKQMNLTPRTGWGGRGMIGCHLVPL